MWIRHRSKSAQAALETAKLNLEYCYIHSPINGRAGARLVDVGNVVQANSTSLLSIQRLDPIYANFTITESDLPAVQKQMSSGTLKAAVRLPSDPENAARNGRVEFLDNAVQNGSGTVNLRATHEQRRPSLLARPVCGREARSRDRERSSADSESGGADQPAGPFVYVVKSDDTAELRPVKLGQRQGDKVVVTEGLAPNERVVLAGPNAGSPGRQSACRWQLCCSARFECQWQGQSESRRPVVNLSELFIRRPVMTVALTVSVILFGVVAYFRLPVSDLPAIDYPVIQVQVNYPGATPETMANNVATPLERQFMQIPGLELVTSNNVQGHSSFVLQFDLSKSLDGAATDVQAAITRAQGQLARRSAQPSHLHQDQPQRPADHVHRHRQRHGDRRPALRLRQHADRRAHQHSARSEPGCYIRNAIGGAHQSGPLGNGDPQYHAGRSDQRDQERHRLYRRRTIRRSASQLPAATARTADHGRPIRRPDCRTNQWRSGLPEGCRPTTESVQDERIDMRFWVRGYPQPGATVFIGVFRRAGVNAVEVAKSVRDLLPSIQSQLPGSVLLFRPTTARQTIVTGINDVKTTLYIAFVLVVMVIFVFLGRATDTLIPAVALPLSLLLTFIAMKLLGYSLDNLSLMALDTGHRLPRR